MSFNIFGLYEFTVKLSDLLYFAVLIAAFLISLGLTPVMRRIALKVNAVDNPGGRKSHTEPTPLMGGVATTAAFIITVLVASYLLLGGVIPRTIIIIACGSLLMCIVGYADDRVNLPPLFKFSLQIAIASLTVIFGGVIQYISVFGYIIKFGVLSAPVTVLWIVLVTNSLNLIDGLDGLACGVSALSSFALFITSLFVMGDYTTAVIAVALCGAALGFLPYNAHPASIFMGDAGALTFGYVLACTSAFGYFKGHTFFAVVMPGIILAVPIWETVSSFFGRLVHKKAPFTADRSHLHFRLIALGFSHRAAVTLIYLATAGFCASAVLFTNYKEASLIIAGASVIFISTLRLAADTSARSKEKSNAPLAAARSAEKDSASPASVNASPEYVGKRTEADNSLCVLCDEPDAGYVKIK